MIQPIHIKYDVCPDCGAPWCQLGKRAFDQKIQQHVNGGIWEYVVFTCGRKDEFIPNFDRIVTQYPCTRTEDMRVRVEKRKKALQQITDLIKSVDVDDNFRERIARDYRYLSVD